MKKTITRLLSLFFALLLVLPLAACSSKSPTVMKIGDYEVSYDMLRYFVMNYKRDYEAAVPGKLYVDPDLQAELTENTNDTLKEFAAYYLLVKKHKLKLTDEKEKEVEAKITSLRSGYGSEDDYKADLEKNYVTEEVLRGIYTMQAYCDALYAFLTDEYHGIFMHDDATIMADVEKGNYFSDEYILLHADSAEDRVERKAAAEDIAARAANGESLVNLSEEYKKKFPGEYYDPETFEYIPDVLYNLDKVFRKGEMLSYFEDALGELNVGQVSAVIERPEGFLVIKRLNLDVDNNFNAIIASYLSSCFFGYVEETAAGLTVVMTKKYRDLKYFEME